MGILAKGVRRAFEEFAKSGDIYEFAVDMAEVGDRCRSLYHSRCVREEIFKIEAEHPKCIPYKQSAKYLKAKSKKKKGVK